jgi:hypothetical protein
MQLSNSFVFILPDKGKSTKQQPYADLEKELDAMGLSCFGLDIRWEQHKSFQECSFEVTKKIQELKNEFAPQRIFILSHGVGAVIAAQLGHMFHVDGLLLCSLPSIYAQEQEYLSWGQRYRNRKLLFAKQSFLDYPAEEVKIPTIFLQGEKEQKRLTSEILESRQAVFTCSEVIVVPKAGKNIKHKNYKKAILEQMKLLLGL